MRPLFFAPTTTTVVGRGIGPASDCSRCEVREKLNGSYELTMDLPASSRHFSEIGDRTLILAKPNPYDPLQLFRIYDMTKPSRMTVSIKARHVSYDLDGYPVAPFTAQSAAAAVAAMNSNQLISNPFSFSTDMSVSKEMKVSVPTAARALLGEQDQSLLRIYQGELYFDQFRVQLLRHRGADRGYVLAYGKNLIDLSQERNISELYNGVLPYWQEDETVIRGSVQMAPGTWNYSRIKPVDLTREFDEQPTAQQLNAAGQAYISREKIGVPEVNIKAKFVPPGSLGFTRIDELQMGDDVTVRFEKLGIDEKSRMVGYTYDVLNERYSSVEIGTVRQTAASAITDASRLKSGKISSERFGGRSIGGGALKKNTVSEDELGNGSVTVNKIVDGAVESIKIADGAVTGIKVLDQAISYAKLDEQLQIFYTDILAANAIYSQFLKADGSVNASVVNASGYITVNGTMFKPTSYTINNRSYSLGESSGGTYRPVVDGQYSQVQDYQSYDIWYTYSLSDSNTPYHLTVLGKVDST